MRLVITVLAWLALPCLLIAIADDWFLRPRRQVATPPRPDPPLLVAVYYAVPVVVVAVVLKVLGSETLDFSLVLALVVVISGLIWLVDKLVVAPRRRAAALAAGREPSSMMPVTVDYARSFFPVALIVLLIRAFLFEPFRIPSDSMMPTLVDGDFILVNKFDYGLRLPVTNTKILNIGEPQRGDVVVFRFPPNPSVNYIKRVVGLPGDHVAIFDDHIVLNGKTIPLKFDGIYDDGCYHNMRLSTEKLGKHVHELLSCLTPDSLAVAPGPTCDRKLAQNYVCDNNLDGGTDMGNHAVMVVPPHEYLMIGDNRDNSYDSRYWGFVPEANLVGKAVLIWFNWDLGRPGGPNWSRIGRRIE